MLSKVRACRLCAGKIPEPIRPVLQVDRRARILVAGQAPGRKVQVSGIPFDDASGERLRDWMGVSAETFYDEKQIAILPMAFCYPGKGKSGDLAPPPICAETWRRELLAAMPALGLTLVIGQYAQRWHLAEARQSLTETVQHWRDFGDAVIPLPHPSPRNNIWLAKNPWFTDRLIPDLRARVRRALAG